MSIAINQFEVIPQQSTQPSVASSQKGDKASASATGPAAVQEQVHLLSSTLRHLEGRRARARAH